MKIEQTILMAKMMCYGCNRRIPSKTNVYSVIYDTGSYERTEQYHNMCFAKALQKEKWRTLRGDEQEWKQMQEHGSLAESC